MDVCHNITHFTCFTSREVQILTQLPRRILQSLTYMDVCHNAINKLPAEIGACTNLRHLNISFNRIPGFPSALGNLEELTYFAFDTNLLRRLPLEFRKLRQLTRLQALILLALLVLVQRTQKYKY